MHCVTGAITYRAFDCQRSERKSTLKIGHGFVSPKQLAIKRATVDGLSDRVHLDTLRPFQVSNRSTHFQRSIIPAPRQVELRNRRFEQLFRPRVHLAERAHRLRPVPALHVPPMSRIRLVCSSRAATTRRLTPAELSPLPLLINSSEESLGTSMWMSILSNNSPLIFAR